MLRNLADLPLSELEQETQFDQQACRTTKALANVHPRSDLGQSAEKAYAAFLGFYIKSQEAPHVENGPGRDGCTLQPTH